MKHYLLYLCIAMLFASCRQANEPSQGGDQMSFAAQLGGKEDDWSDQTRGAVTDNSNINQFAAFCYHTDLRSWDEVKASALPNRMFDQLVTRSGSDWSYNPPVEWLGGDGSYFTFFGYSPRAAGTYQDPGNSQGNNITLASADTDTGAPVIRYETMDDVPRQVDLLVATPIYNTRPVEKVRMKFSHALSRICFKAWSQQRFVTVKSITIKDAQYVATFALDGTAPTLEANTKTFVLDNINKSLSMDQSNMTDLSEGSNAFMLLPQDFASNATAEIIVKYLTGTEERTSVKYLLGTNSQKWEANKSYTYTLELTGKPFSDLVVSGVTITDWMVDSEDNMSTISPIPSIEIDGLRWATGNLVANGSNGCKVGNPEDCGLCFSFGSLVGWANGPTGDGTGDALDGSNTLRVQPSTYTGALTWPSDSYLGGTEGTDYRLPRQDNPQNGTGDPCRFYLGSAWRTPTNDEWSLLLGGRLEYTDKSIPLRHLSSALAFPAGGWYTRDNSALGGANRAVHYWSSSLQNDYLSNLEALSVIAYAGPNQYSTFWGTALPGDGYMMPVRCVSGTYVTPPTTANSYATYPKDGAMQAVRFNALKKPVAKYAVGSSTPVNATGTNPSTADVGLENDIAYQAGDKIEVSWQTAVNHANSGDMVIKSITLGADGVATVEVNGAGNAVLSYKRSNGTILWNYHIWATDSNPFTTHYATGSNVNGTAEGGAAAKFMDRDLGALSAATAKPAAADAYKYFGVLYQHGRPTPFTGQGAGTRVNAHTKIFNGSGAEITSTIGGYTKSNTAVSSVTSAIQTSNTYYYSSAPGNWTWYGFADISLWSDYGTNKSIYDPCPYGYRVPINGSWAGFPGTAWTAGIMEGGTVWSNTWWPAAGFRSYNSGTIGNVGNAAYYWSSTQYSGAYRSYSLTFDYSGVANPSNYGNRSYGFSVRCVEEGY